MPFLKAPSLVQALWVMTNSARRGVRSLGSRQPRLQGPVDNHGLEGDPLSASDPGPTRFQSVISSPPRGASRAPPSLRSGLAREVSALTGGPRSDRALPTVEEEVRGRRRSRSPAPSRRGVGPRSGCALRARAGRLTSAEDLSTSSPSGASAGPPGREQTAAREEFEDRGRRSDRAPGRAEEEERQQQVSREVATRFTGVRRLYPVYKAGTAGWRRELYRRVLSCKTVKESRTLNVLIDSGRAVRGSISSATWYGAAHRRARPAHGR
jgi:hypothetical protein